MLKVMLAGATALAIAGSTLVYAQQRPAGPDAAQDQRGHSRWQMSAEDAQAFADARIAGLKAGLRLTPEQEKSWPAIETAIRELAKDRIERRDARRKDREQRAERRADRSDQPRERDTIASLRQRAETMGKQAAGLTRLADAAEPLYKSLDDGQKRRLAMLTRSMNSGGRHHWRGRDRGDERDQERGDDRGRHGRGR